VTLDIPFPLCVSSCGAVTAVGNSSAPTFAALRAGISAFRATCYRTIYGEKIIGAPVLSLEARALGVDYLASLAGPALNECLMTLSRTERARTGFLLGVGESLSMEEGRTLVRNLSMAQGLGSTSRLAVVHRGEQSITPSLAQAAEWIDKGLVDHCVVGGVETFLTRTALRELETGRRLKTSRCSDGVIPGEAACFVVVTRFDSHRRSDGLSVVVRGLGFSNVEQGSGRRGDGLSRAMRGALGRAGVAARQVGFRASNQSGESVAALESGIAAMRVFRDPGPYPPAWLPAESVGMVGAPIGALLLGWTATGFAKDYAPGEVALFELTSADGFHAALVCTAG
jgi:3-oxoacyl-[acyl-carrier-protein] synthase-1